MIGDGSIVTDSKLVRCVLGIRSFVGENTELIDVVMMGADYYETTEQRIAKKQNGLTHIGIGKNCKITHSIVDKNARIGDNCVLNPTGKADGRYLNGDIVIRDGVLIVVKGASIPAGSTI